MRFLSVIPMLTLGLLLVGCGKEPEQQAAAEPSVGEQLYTKNCKVCHAQGLNGAPIVGNAKMWSPRAAQGEDVLVSHAVNGFGLMPAKGGKTELTEDDIRHVVRYMLSQIQ